MESIKLDLIIERGEDGLWGRVTYNDNLIVDSGKSVAELQEKLKKLLFEFEGLSPESLEFEHFYDVYALFVQFDYLNITKVAKRAGINPGLLRQYASQVKHPSATQAKKLENTIHQLADELKEAMVYAE